MIDSSPFSTSFYDTYVAILDSVISVAVLLSAIVAGDRLFLVAKYVILKLKIRLFGGRPEERYNFVAFPTPYSSPSLHFPKVAVQLPMFNERTVCQAAIDYSCSLQWPRDRLKIQVLDDSTDKTTRDLVDSSVAKWRERGLNIVCVRRTNREGYKSGALKEGLALLSGYQYVAIFDADFKPNSDFLMRMVPYLHSNDDVAYVQARWVFSNPNESYLTKVQEISLTYHMKCEQWVQFASGLFFHFNGTAGIWRKKAIEDLGGWSGRTTVEDMDLSLRAYLAGWKAMFIEDVCVLNELPSSYFAYRKQQHRWSCGPVKLWRCTSNMIWASKISWTRKLEVHFGYFIIRKISTHFVSLGFFCFLVPLSIYTSQTTVPIWALIYLPVAVTLCTGLFTKWGWIYSPLYVLFENAMSLVKVWAVMNALLDLERAQEWIVTAKFGSSDKRRGRSLAKLRSCRLYGFESCLGWFVIISALYAVYTQRWSFSLFLFCQGVVLISFGLSLVDSGALLGRPLLLHWLFACLPKSKKTTNAKQNSSSKQPSASAPSSFNAPERSSEHNSLAGDKAVRSKSVA